MRELRAVLLVFGAMAAVGASVAAAQDLPVTIRNAPPEVTVEFLLVSGSETKNARGVADRNGVLELVLEGMNELKNKTYQAIVTDCEGRPVRITLVAQGTPEPECGEQVQIGAQTHRNCRCRRLAVVFIGRDATRLTVDAATGSVTAVEGPPVTDGVAVPIGFLIDADLGSARMADDNSCQEVIDVYRDAGINVTCSKDATVPIFSLDGGVTFARFLGVKVGYMQLGQVTLEANGTSGSNSVNQTGFFGRTRGVTVTGVVRVPLGPIVPFAEAGFWRWSADSGSTVRVTVGNQQFSESFNQEDSGTDPVFGAGVEFWFTRFLGLSAGLKSLRLSSDENADDGGEVDERFTMFFVGLKLGRR